MDINKEAKQFINDWIALGNERSATIQLNKLLNRICREQREADFNFLSTPVDLDKVEHIGWLCRLCDTPHFKSYWDKLPLLTDK